MRAYSLFVPLLAVFLLAVLAVPAMAISTPDVTFVPDKVSTNGAFIMIANPHQTASESLRVYWGATWTINGLQPQGTFPRQDGQYACYFSNSDNASTCGPSIFNSIGNNTIIVYAINQDGTQTNRTSSIDVGNIQIQPTVFTNGKNLSVRWYIPELAPNTLRYKVYYYPNLTETTYTGILQNSGNGYSVDIPTGPGEYLVSLRIDRSGTNDFGGTVVRFSIPETGIYLPGGEFMPSNLIVAPASFEVLLNKGQNFQKTGFSITNVGGTPIGNITTALPAGYEKYLSISFSNDTITPNGTIFYTITIGGAQHTMEINTRVNITSNNITIGQIPVNVNVSVVNECDGQRQQPCSSTETRGISISPQTWTGEHLAGQPTVLNFTVTNMGNTTLSNFSYSSGFGSSLSVRLPGTLLPNVYATASAELDPSYAGTQSGTITVTSSQGSASIAVLLNFHEDISSSISDLKAEYADFQSNLTASQRVALNSAFNDIDSDISSAESDQESGRYDDAETHYNSAAAKLSALKNAFSGSATPITPPSGGIDPTILIIIIVVAACAVAFIIIRRRRGGGGEEELEEELAEDFGPLPEEK